MITREEAVRRLEGVEKEIGELKKALREGWQEAPVKDATRVFLEKCEGWEDRRSPEEIIAEIYALRTASDRGKALFDKRP